MKPFTTIAVAVLGLMSVGQLIRFLQGWEVLVNGIAIPTWPSAVASLFTGVLAVMLWRESHR